MEFVNLVIYASIYLGLVATTFYALSYFSYRKKEKLLFTDKELPSLSVIIPMYNEEECAAATIESILKSDYPNSKFEIIVVDDGSKDNTLKIAKSYIKKGVKVFTKQNGGKGAALNYGIKRARGEIIISMDADTFVEPYSAKEMVRYFKDPKVMSVTPAMCIYKPKTILQKIQHAEYLIGLFLRKAFASLNAIHITPGAFSAYRKSFFEKHGGYDENNITEDLELSLRIQIHGYSIENAPNAPAYTIAPEKFIALLKQRRRWYGGLMRNTWKYRKIFCLDYGDLGMFVMPVAWISIFFSVFVILYMFFKTLNRIREEILFLNSINFNFSSLGTINAYVIERHLFLLITNPIIIFLFFFIIVIGAYLFYTKGKIEKTQGLALGLVFYFAFFALLFGFWWVISIIYVLLNRKIVWR